MRKSELIDAISSINESADREFLQEFSERELNDYMRQLEGVTPPLRITSEDLEECSEVTA